MRTSNDMPTRPQTIVLIPCYNEEASISRVVRSFREILPHATVVVYDNNSRDATADLARQAGAIVKGENRQGKGHVIRRMFADEDADEFVLVDGDGTYNAADVTTMLELLRDQSMDMVVGLRRETHPRSYRRGHRFGNRALTMAVGVAFGEDVQDLLSGFRVFSRRFVKSFPALSTGFEIETEMAVHALEMRMRIGYTETAYGARATSSPSKLRTWRDGARILLAILLMLRAGRPSLFFGVIAGALAAAALAIGTPVLIEFIKTGLVPRVPSAILATGLSVLSALFFMSGLILEGVASARREMKRLHYLSLSPPTRALDAGQGSPNRHDHHA